MRKSSRRNFFRTVGAGAGAALLPAPSAASGAPTSATQVGPLTVWCEEPQRRVYSQSLGGFKADPHIRLAACRNERVAVQIALRSSRELMVRASAEPAGGAQPRIRAVGLIPCEELGIAVPDPIEERNEIELKSGETRSFWLDFQVPPEAKAGAHAGRVLIQAGALQMEIPLSLEVLPATLPDPRQSGFQLSIWQDPAAIARVAGTPLWSERHWELIRTYARNAAAHGQKTVTATVVEDPWGSQTGFAFPSMVTWRRDGEWTSPGAGAFRFDYKIFDRYVETFAGEGIRTIHCFSPAHWGPLAYYDEKGGKTRYRKYEGGGEWWAAAWNQFLPDLINHLKRRGWLDKTYLGMDEAPHEAMEKVWSLLRRYSPDLKMHLAGGGGRYGSESEDLSYYYFSLRDENPEFPKPDPIRRRAEGKQTTIYVCTGPTHPNTFLYSPAYGSRMLPWLAWKHGYDGFLRWALNSWPARLWEQPNYRFGSGDNYLVYPGPDGPLDSIRWELLFAGIQDFECLRLAGDVPNAVALATRDEDPFVNNRESNLHRARLALNDVLRKLG
jgi:hypothetical protein